MEEKNSQSSDPPLIYLREMRMIKAGEKQISLTKTGIRKELIFRVAETAIDKQTVASTKETNTTIHFKNTIRINGYAD
jgi:hypothetical protein